MKACGKLCEPFPSTYDFFLGFLHILKAKITRSSTKITLGVQKVFNKTESEVLSYHMIYIEKKYLENNGIFWQKFK